MNEQIEIFCGCDNYWDSLPVRRREKALAFAGIFISIGSVFIIREHPPLWVALVVVAAMALSIMGLSFFIWRRERYLRELERRWEPVPWPIKIAAIQTHGRWWREAAIECHEGHMPGECPLCGAT